MTEVMIKLTESDFNLLRRLLVNEIQCLELDKEGCSGDVEFNVIRKNLDSRINHINELCKKICDAYNNEVTKNGKV